jgi:quercetin dioxygenase-like cupin family protein
LIRLTTSTTAERTIHDPTTGENITFLETSEESGGHRVVMRLGLAPGTVVPPHAHPFEEAFECMEGRLQFRLNGRSMELRPGGGGYAPPPVGHRLNNNA